MTYLHQLRPKGGGGRSCATNKTFPAAISCPPIDEFITDRNEINTKGRLAGVFLLFIHRLFLPPPPGLTGIRAHVSIFRPPSTNELVCLTNSCLTSAAPFLNVF